MNSYFNLEEVARKLEIQPSTVKKYYSMFEDEGYKFKRSNQGRMVFTNGDVDLFRKLIKLKNEPGTKVKDAILSLSQEYRETRKSTNYINDFDLKHEIQQLNDKMESRFDTIDSMLNDILERLDGFNSHDNSKQIREILIKVDSN